MLIATFLDRAVGVSIWPPERIRWMGRRGCTVQVEGRAGVCEERQGEVVHCEGRHVHDRLHAAPSAPPMFLPLLPWVVVAMLLLLLPWRVAQLVLSLLLLLLPVVDFAAANSVGAHAAAASVPYWSSVALS